MSLEDPSIAAFVAHARSLLGARWRHRGRKPWALDCLGLIVLSARAAGWPVDDERYYGRNPWDNRLRSQMIRQLGSPIADKREMRNGDIALIRWFPDDPTHVGIIGEHINGGCSLIHCDNINGCVEHSIDSHFMECIIEVYRPCAKFCQ